jgi:hypothetical protein
MLFTTSGANGAITYDLLPPSPMIFKSPSSAFTAPKRSKSFARSALLQKDRVRTKFRPSKAPHYFYTALPNDSFVSEQPDHDSQDSSASSSPAATPKPRRRLTPAISLTLQNVGSVARDHLASERTFLAYMRTSLALTSAGVGMFQVLCILKYC